MIRSFRLNLLLGLLGGLFLTVTLACSGGASDQEGEACLIGAEGCVCTSSGQCEPGLSCLSEICVDATALVDPGQPGSGENPGSGNNGDGDGDGDGGNNGGGDGDGDGDGGNNGDGDGDGDGGNNGGGDGDGDGDGTAPTPCSYPSYDNMVDSTGDVIAPLVFDEAVFPDGSTGPFSFEAFHCDDAWAGYSSLSIVLVAEWCPNCPGYISSVGDQLSTLDSNGSLLIYIVAEDTYYQPDTTASADTYISNYIGANKGMRVGGAAIAPWPAIQYSFIPNGLVVNKSDMSVVAYQETSNYEVDYSGISEDLNIGGGGGGGGGGEGGGGCVDDSFEPNDAYTAATEVTPGTYDLQICGSSSDVFVIPTSAGTGSFRFRVLFSHNQDGDIDLHKIDSQNQSLAASESPTDNEELTVQAGDRLALFGWEFNSSDEAAYTLVIDPL